jgi:sugar O-acyltransferase (sialic acid O-acetyltransferase NeuD family)
MNMTPVLLIGGGGHCRSVIDVIESGELYQVAGIVQPASHGLTPILGYPVRGDDDALPDLLSQIPCALVTVGQLKDSSLRQRLFSKLLELGAQTPIIVSPHAHVSRYAQVGRGTVVLHGALINAAARVGENCIINSMALVEHNARIGPHCHISTGARLNGDVEVGSGCFIGSGTVIYQGVTIGEGSVIGAGCVISCDVAAHTIMRYEA